MSRELAKREDKTKTSTELIANIKDEKKRKFLELYPKSRRITATAGAMGMDRRNIHYWLNRDNAFSDAFHALKNELDRERIEDYLANIHEIAFDPSVPPQSRLLGSFFELKALDDRYKDKAPDRNINIGEIIVHSAIPRPKYPEIEGEYEEMESAST